MAAKIKTKVITEEAALGRGAETVKRFYHKPFFIASIVALLAAGALVLLFWQNQKLKNNLASLQDKLNNQELSSQAVSNSATAHANQDLIDAVNKLMILPADEQPTVATVTDLDKLKGQPFFANAQIGDKVLIYAQAKKAILYRPSEDKIIELAPLNIGGGSAAAGQQLTVEIRNGSGKGGAAASWQKKLSANKSFVVVAVGNAQGPVYPKSILVDLSGGQSPDLINQLQQLSAADIAQSLPAGEGSTTAEALLILGQQ